MQNQTYKFYVHGMHCNSCVLLIEEELGELPNVSRVKSVLKGHHLEITGDFGSATQEDIALILTKPLQKHGYTVSVEKEIKNAKWNEFLIAIPITIVFVLLFILLQKIGLVNLVNASKVSYSTALLIGVIASLSTCMAVVGGLVLSMSANFAKEGDKMRPQVLFHVGRLISFFVLGGVIGLLGKAFQLNSSITIILDFVIGLVMIVLGLNLLDVFSWAKKIQPSMPKTISKYALETKKINHTLTPFLVGIITFFLPCGFTQAMQVYTLSTGSFYIGALTMFSFAIGTLPVLALLSFSSFSIHKSSNSGIFFKSVGLIVIIFAFINLINAFSLLGIHNVQNINIQSKNASVNNISVVDGKQIISINAKDGFSPLESLAKAGIPTIIRFNTSSTFDCSASVNIPDFSVDQILPNSGSTDIDIGIQKAGIYHGTCGMGMYPFDIVFQ